VTGDLTKGRGTMPTLEVWGTQDKSRQEPGEPGEVRINLGVDYHRTPSNLYTGRDRGMKGTYQKKDENNKNTRHVTGRGAKI
jgi:hypothetical protein